MYIYIDTYTYSSLEYVLQKISGGVQLHAGWLGGSTELGNTHEKKNVYNIRNHTYSIYRFYNSIIENSTYSIIQFISESNRKASIAQLLRQKWLS